MNKHNIELLCERLRASGHAMTVTQILDAIDEIRFAALMEGVRVDGETITTMTPTRRTSSRNRRKSPTGAKYSLAVHLDSVKYTFSLSYDIPIRKNAVPVSFESARVPCQNSAAKPQNSPKNSV